MKKTTIFIILDAFRWDYISEKNTPNLCKMAEDGIYVKKLITSAGFAERTPIFTGTYPDTSGYYTAFSYDPQNSPFKPIRPFSKILSILQKNDFMNKAVHHTIYKLGKIMQKYGVINTYMSPALIPFEILPYIGVTEDEKNIFEPNSLKVESIFDILHEEDIRFEYLIHPVADILGNDDAILKELLKRSKKENDCFFVQFISSDHECHLHGSESDTRIKVINEIDNKIGIIKEHFEKIYDNVTFFVIGDHGMMDVIKKIDIYNNVMKIAKKKNLRLGKDFVMFLDSTLARFWFLNSKSGIIKEFIIENFHEYGKLIIEDLAKEYRIPSNDKRYGDFIFWADPGVLINPDYFWSYKKPPKAMHGYDPLHEKMKGFAVVYSPSYNPSFIEQAHLEDVCPTLCDLLGIKYPKENEGKSLLMGGKR
jgi:predicted AlkP superfamily pyrophosphatase or phosphodiesterase